MKEEEFFELEKQGQAKPHHRVLASLERVRGIAANSDDLESHRDEIRKICEKALTWSEHISSIRKSSFS